MFGRRTRLVQRPVLRNSTHDARGAPARRNTPHQQFGGFGEDIAIRAKLRNQFRTALAKTDRATRWSKVDVDHLVEPVSTNAA
jgi:hypothetical protein